MSTDVSTEQLSKFHPLSSLNNESLSQLLDKIQIQDLSAGAVLFQKGSTDDKHYYLLEGEIDLLVDSGVLKSIQANTKEACEPVLQRLPRTATAKARINSKIIVLNSDVLDMMLTWDQSSNYQVQELNAGSNDETDDWMLQLLRTEAFHRIPPANIQTIFMKMETIPVRPGEKIITQGDEGDYFYIIKNGRCLVTRSTPNQPKGIKLAELTDGNTFGEEALISDSKRNATVTMLTSGSVTRLSKNDFLELLNQPSLEKIEFIEAQKLVDTDSAVWVDVRLPSEYKDIHIKGSINIPLISLRLKMNSLKNNKRYIVYCDTERRSSAASFLLNESGLDSIVLTGGINSVPDQYRETSN